MVRNSVPKGKRAVVTTPVEVYKMKKDAATGGLADKDPFKVRISYNGDQSDRIERARGTPDETPRGATNADDVLVKVTVASAVKKGRRLTQVDVPHVKHVHIPKVEVQTIEQVRQIPVRPGGSLRKNTTRFDRDTVTGTQV